MLLCEFVFHFQFQGESVISAASHVDKVQSYLLVIET
jgi:hypothetical protein